LSAEFQPDASTLESDVTDLSRRVLPFVVVAVMSASHPTEEEQNFFEKERERHSKDIVHVSSHLLPKFGDVLTHTQDFEELISSTNMLNRKLEDVVGMKKEIDPIADLWSSFYELMREQKPDIEFPNDGQGIPGTGGHVVTGKMES